MPILRLENVSKSFWSGPNRLHVLRHFDLTVEKGEQVAIVGRSGSGKTTLLNLIAGLDRLDEGRIHLDGKELSLLKRNEWDHVRQREVGIVFQFNQLLPEFTALENVMLPGLLIEPDASVVQKKARELLHRMAMDGRTEHLPSQLSGGEQQRVAIARALINSPKLLLADEPTGSLDLESGHKVFNLLQSLQKDLGISCLLVTHNPGLARLCARIHPIERSEDGDFFRSSGV